MIVGWDISRGGDLGKGKITGESEKRLGRSSFLANPQSCLPLFNFNSWAMTSSYDKQQSRMGHMRPDERVGVEVQPALLCWLFRIHIHSEINFILVEATIAICR